MTVMVTNLSDEPNTVEFDTTQQYSLYAFDEQGRRYHLGPRGESPVRSSMQLEALETKVFEEAWDGHVWSDGKAVYLSPGRYEIEAAIKAALSNTEFVWLEE
jgi:hypothetical protein